MRLISLAIILCTLCLSVSGCQSTSHYLMPLGDENSQAEGAAYTAEGMHFRKPMPRRTDQPVEFYYKHCSENSERSYVSKTSYSCTEPF